MARDYDPGEAIEKPPFAGDTRVPKYPHEEIGFELDIQHEWWSFAPIYYPEAIRIGKNRKLDRNGRQCGGENISVKTIKNREVHVKGKLLSTEIPLFNKLMDYEGNIDFISPKTPDGGLECRIHKIELGELVGWDPIEKEWKFKYSVDLVSTSRDESDGGRDNAIVSAILNPTNAASDITDISSEDRQLLSGSE